MTRIRDTDNVSIECRMSGISRTLSKIDPVSLFDRSVSIYCAEDTRNGCQTIENYGAVANIESVAFIGMDGSIFSSVTLTSTRQRCCLPCSTMPVAGAFRLDWTSIAYEVANPS